MESDASKDGARRAPVRQPALNLPRRRRMRVLWLSHFVPWPPTGHGALQRSYQLAAAAGGQHEVDLLALAPPTAAAAELDLRTAREALAEFCRSVEVFPLVRDRLRFRRAWLLGTGMMGSRSYWERWFAAPALRERLRALPLQDYDVIHLDSVLLAGYADLLPLDRVVLNHHNVESSLIAQRGDASGAPPARWLLHGEARKVRRLEADLAARVAINVVVSPLDAERLRAICPTARTAVVPNAVDLDYFRSRTGASGDPHTMIFAGGMDWFPNRDAMLSFARDIWPALRSANPARTALVVGRHPPRELVSMRDGRFSVLGFVPDVRPYLERAAVYICPMRRGGGTRLKILDALAMERALVSTELGVEGLGLVSGIHYLAANTPQEFNRQIGRIEGDPALRIRLGRAGREFVTDRFTWQAAGAALLEAYAAVTPGEHQDVSVPDVIG